MRLPIAFEDAEFAEFATPHRHDHYFFNVRRTVKEKNRLVHDALKGNPFLKY